MRKEFNRLEFAERLKIIVKAHGGAYQFAKKCGWTSSTSIHKYLKGKGLPRIDKACVMAYIGGIPVEWLLTGLGKNLSNFSNTPTDNKYIKVIEEISNERDRALKMLGKYQIEKGGI
jgi:transcriptional regulator with XRE-family HTH domain